MVVSSIIEAECEIAWCGLRFRSVHGDSSGRSCWELHAVFMPSALRNLGMSVCTSLFNVSTPLASSVAHLGQTKPASVISKMTWIPASLGHMLSAILLPTRLPILIRPTRRGTIRPSRTSSIRHWLHALKIVAVTQATAQRQGYDVLSRNKRVR